MLILTRRLAQSFRIGNDIEIRVLGIDHHGEIRIGIAAPKQVKILRSELLSPQLNNPPQRESKQCGR